MEKKVVNGVFACAFDAEKVKAMRNMRRRKASILTQKSLKFWSENTSRSCRDSSVNILISAMPRSRRNKRRSQNPQQRTAKPTRKQRRFLRRISRETVKILSQKMLSLPQILRLTAILQLRNIQRAPPLRSRPRGVFGDMQRSARITASSL